jgi:hypothetical protein
LLNTRKVPESADLGPLSTQYLTWPVLSRRQLWVNRQICGRSGVVLVFGRRDDDTIHALLRPASKKRQGTKSREVGHRRCRGRYGDLAAVRDLSAG